MNVRTKLAFEIALLFIIPPLLIVKGLLPRSPFPYIVVGFVFSLVVLKSQASAAIRDLFSLRDLPRYWQSSAVRCLVLSLALLGLAAALEPERLFFFPRTRPLVWIMVVCLYPILSAFPQEVIFRSMFFSRYRPLFSTDRAMILASAFFFAFTHILFLSSLSFLVSFIGGVIFGARYRETRSLPVVALEHALLGIAVFTVGLGHHFYHGAVRP